MIELSAKLQRLLQKHVICFFATIRLDGSPQMTQTWVDTDGTYILINTVEGHQKHRNVQRDPRVVLSVIDPAQWEHAVSIRGRVVDITKEGADLHFKHLTRATLEARSIATASLVRCVSCSRMLLKRYGNERITLCL
jgi:PPOX class probable F420-dependent enzyme